MNNYVEIFLYVPEGDQSPSEQTLKWVSNFNRILQVGLNQFHQAKARLVNTIFTTNDLEEIIKKSPIVIQLILSENIDKNKLIQDYAENGKINVNQVIQIQYLPVKIDINKQEQIKTLNFFDETGSKSLKLDENIEKIRDDVWLKFLDLSMEIRRIISELSTKESKDRKTKSVFLAYTSVDQNSNRKILEREIQQLGYTIYDPSKVIYNADQFKDFVNQSISTSSLSLHIIGNSELPMVQGQDISLVEYQNKLFVEYINANKKAQVFRLVWIPPDIKPKTEKQKTYIESFMHQVEAMSNTEIVQAPIEVFKSIIQRKLSTHQDKSVVESTKESINNKSVYVIYNQSETDKVNKIIDEFEKKNISVLKTEKLQSNIESLRLHHKNLVQCDAVLIFQSENNRLWLNSKISDILKAPGIGRKKKYAAKALYAPNNSAVITGLRDLIVLDTKGPISQSVQPIIEILENYDTSR